MINQLKLSGKPGQAPMAMSGRICCRAAESDHSGVYGHWGH